jgi:hypothetical protein
MVKNVISLLNLKTVWLLSRLFRTFLGRTAWMLGRTPPATNGHTTENIWVLLTAKKVCEGCKYILLSRAALPAVQDLGAEVLSCKVNRGTGTHTGSVLVR